jgi:hypothetical protein
MLLKCGYCVTQIIEILPYLILNRAEAVSGRLPSTATPVQCHVSLCGICGGRSGSETCFLRVLLLPCQFVFRKLPHIHYHPVNGGSRVSSVGIATGCRLDGRGSIPGRDKRFLCAPQRPDRFEGPPRFISNGYRGLFPRG